jgi:hypothetical protein
MPNAWSLSGINLTLFLSQLLFKNFPQFLLPWRYPYTINLLTLWLTLDLLLHSPTVLQIILNAFPLFSSCGWYTTLQTGGVTGSQYSFNILLHSMLNAFKIRFQSSPFTDLRHMSRHTQHRWVTNVMPILNVFCVSHSHTFKQHFKHFSHVSHDFPMQTSWRNPRPEWNTGNTCGDLTWLQWRLHFKCFSHMVRPHILNITLNVIHSPPDWLMAGEFWKNLHRIFRAKLNRFCWFETSHGHCGVAARAGWSALMNSDFGPTRHPDWLMAGEFRRNLYRIFHVKFSRLCWFQTDRSHRGFVAGAGWSAPMNLDCGLSRPPNRLMAGEFTMNLHWILRAKFNWFCWFATSHGHCGSATRAG